MSSVVPLRGVRVGEGRTKIAAALTATDPDALMAESDRVRAAGVDIAEWRADYLLAADPAADLARLTGRVRDRLGAVPLLLTVRSGAEGGRVDLDDDGYAQHVSALLEDGAADAVDLELARAAVLPQLREQARHQGAAILLSQHDVQATPPADELVSLLTQMAGAGADIVKVAVTARTPRDVLELLAATDRARADLAVPVVTMAMGPAGLASRLCGEIFGSAVTFGAVDRASAPGQIDVARLRDVVDLVHDHIQEPRGAL